MSAELSPTELTMSSTTQSPPQHQTPSFDPEYLQWLMSSFPTDAATPPLTTIPLMRQNTEHMIRALYAKWPAQPSVMQTSHIVTSADGTLIEVTRFSPPQEPGKQENEAGPAILHFHGGGHVSNHVDMFAPYLSDLVVRTGIPVFSVEYRLAPEHAFPAALDDGLAALRWLSSSAVQLGIDPTRICLMGESSGGGLAAGIALMARDKALEPRVKRMLLVYPMLDDRSISTNPAWDAENRGVKLLTMCWEAYLGPSVKVGDPQAEVSIYAAPGRAEKLEGLPEAWVEVGALDEFRDECVDFAGRLEKCEVRVWDGVPHGFDAAREIKVSRRAVEGRVGFLAGL
ncbi:uncharacterized protein CC84DRAFT_1167887 [Paraphaeosphaeria sporulosa]|uniref:Alpha/beta hydrolase fold-3 domain-containing protein n=1 Tax=Paraphaeosphaeria sporulosa TaxID=1460663 RepID=A0A177C243_9PLEO|nr:uncharacterized protein CC84DRAFT_1167887 [Paraphaeosphaeria sporulosa]OAG01723.1 hypothetical protein CC84DRAFT_1167887 [Paraphaeosphaeria sporulosa]